MARTSALNNSYEESYQSRRTQDYRNSAEVGGGLRVTEKDLCNVFYRIDSDFDGEVDFWEMEKILMVRDEFQGGSIPIKRAN